MERVHDTLEKSESTTKQQDSWALHRKPEDPNLVRSDLPVQLELPFTNEDGGDSVG